jgi:membrane protein
MDVLTAGAEVGEACKKAGRETWQVVDTLRRAAWSAMDHDALNLAQATAYSAIFALFPALIVAAALVGMLPDVTPFRTQLATFFFRVLPSNVIPIVSAYFDQSNHDPHAVRVLLGTAVVSLWGALGTMTTLMEGFRRAHKLPLLRDSFWPMRLRALVLVPLSLLPMVLVSVLVVFGHFVFGNMLGHYMADKAVPEWIRHVVIAVVFVIRWTVALCGSVGIIAVIYHLGTDMTRGMGEYFQPLVKDLLEPWQALRRSWTWNASLPGAVVATVLWFMSTILFGVYVTRFANYSRVYGSLGAAVALMTWLYLIALSILIGAEFNAQRSLQHRDPKLSELLWKLPGLRTRRTGRIAD